MNWKSWLHGLAAAFVGGAAAGVVANFSDPANFNFSDWASLKKLATVCVVSGVIAAAAYLKQSPIPPSGGDDAQG